MLGQFEGNCTYTSVWRKMHISRIGHALFRKMQTEKQKVFKFYTSSSGGSVHDLTMCVSSRGGEWQCAHMTAHSIPYLPLPPFLQPVAIRASSCHFRFLIYSLISSSCLRKEQVNQAGKQTAAVHVFEDMDCSSLLSHLVDMWTLPPWYFLVWSL